MVQDLQSKTSTALWNDERWSSPFNRGVWEKSLCWDCSSWVFKVAQCHGGDKGSAVPVGGPGCAKRSEQIFYMKMPSPPPPKHAILEALGSCDSGSLPAPSLSVDSLVRSEIQSMFPHKRVKSALPSPWDGNNFSVYASGMAVRFEVHGRTPNIMINLAGLLPG